MNANRTKILSTTALIAILLIQMFWMWNTYNINARQLGKECNEILEKAIALELDKTNRCDSFFESGDTIASSNIYNPTLSLYDAIYKKSHQDANTDILTNIADSIFKAEKLPFRAAINKVNMKTGKVMEGKNINSNIFPFLEEVKTNIQPVRLDNSVGFQMTITNGSIYIFRHNWVLLLISILISIVIILSIIDQINYINEQERVRLLREDFSYAMVHDMKSPLTSIIMGTKYLHSGVLEKKPEIKEKYFTIVEDEAQHLLALINRLLTISKLEHGKLNIQKTVVKLKPMIEDVTEKYKAKSDKPIHIAIQLKVTTVAADEEYLKEAISNLIDNATKYSKEKINIRISTLEDNHYIPQFGIRIVHKKLVVSQIFCTFIGDLQQVTNIFDMTTDYKVTELFCIIDEFCKHFDAENAGNLLEDNSGTKRRRRQASLSDSEIMTILLYFHFGTFRNFKHYYLFFIKGTMKSYFPKAVSYNRFVELESRVFFQLMFFLNLGAFGRCTGITFVDSTMIPVCHNLRRYANKVFKGIATDGKGTMGWCHGFKLHLACNDRGEIIAFVLTGANVSDKDPNVFKVLAKRLYGKLFADKGYISQKLFDFLFEDGIQLVTGLRVNMKNKLMPFYDRMMLRKRYIIETINDMLKNTAQIVHSRHRSVNNFVMNLISALGAYCFFDNKPMALQGYCIEDTKQLSLF